LTEKNEKYLEIINDMESAINQFLFLPIEDLFLIVKNLLLSEIKRINTDILMFENEEKKK
jgi:hypothetical protein